MKMAAKKMMMKQAEKMKRKGLSLSQELDEKFRRKRITEKQKAREIAKREIKKTTKSRTYKT